MKRLRLPNLRRRLIRVLKWRRDMERLELHTRATADDEEWAHGLVDKHGWDELREKK